MDSIFPGIPGVYRILILLAIAVAVHVVVRLLRRVTRWALENEKVERAGPKTRTLLGLIASVAVFFLYFAALGLILSELGIPWTAYLASTSIIGLAVAFGSQSLVQDVVMGLTIIFTDLYHVGDLVELGGQTGIVEGVGMRFTRLRNPLGAEVLIPNRSITSLTHYRRGYVRCYVDVDLADGTSSEAIADASLEHAEALIREYPGIFLAPMEVVERRRTNRGRTVLRYKFRIWPGRGGPIEGPFRQELIARLKEIDPKYADWMVKVGYEVEQWKAPLPNRRRPRLKVRS